MKKVVLDFHERQEEEDYQGELSKTSASNEPFSLQVILLKFSPTRSCVSLPRPTTSSGENYLYLFNLRPNICKSGCL